MDFALRALLLTLCLLTSTQAAYSAWQAVEKVEAYSITGQSGAELYASIGDKGPKAGAGRAIAHTNFKLTWTRDYEPQGGRCTLVSAKPKLTITYTLPKPAASLPEAARKSWGSFIAGVAAHERIHGEMIKDLVKEIEVATIGLSVSDDPKCSKIRAEMKQRLSKLSLAQRQRSRDFDKVEAGEGGNMRRLILDLVNGP